MKYIFIGLLALLFAVTACSDEMSGNAGGNVAQSEALLLASELSLARKPIIYFVFDLKENRVVLKSRGILLKQMKIDDADIWGDPVDTSVKVVVKKSTLFEPKRINIDPNKNKEETDASKPPPAPGTFNIDALELTDMPKSYRIDFSDGISLSVRSREQGFIQNLYGAVRYLGWYVSRPILTVWNAVRGKPFTSIYVTMSEEDARSIYWSLVERSENIIYQP